MKNYSSWKCGSRCLRKQLGTINGTQIIRPREIGPDHREIRRPAVNTGTPKPDQGSAAFKKRTTKTLPSCRKTDLTGVSTIVRTTIEIVIDKDT